MAENNATVEVSSIPAPAAPAAVEVKSDAVELKGNVTGQQARKFLTESFLKRSSAESQASAEPADRGSDVAAATTEKPAAPDEASRLSAEAKVAAQAAPEVEAPDVPFNLTHLDSKQREIVEAELKRYRESNQKSIQDRINREVAKTKALREENEKLRGQTAVRSPLEAAPAQQVQQAAPQQAAPFPAAVPFSNISDPGVLQREAQQARLFHSLADDAIVAGPTGARVETDGRRVDLYNIDGAEYTKDQVMNIRRNAREAFQVGIPARMEDLKLRQQNSQQAEAAFPWIRDPSSPDFQRAQAVSRALPFVRNLPNSENLIGLLVEGLKATEARQAAQGKKVPARATPTPPGDQVSFTSVGRTTSRAPDGTFVKQALADEMAKLNGKKGVSGRDMRKFLLRTDQLRNSR